MFKDNATFSGYSVNDIEKAKDFYGGTLGLNASTDEMGLKLTVTGGYEIFLYQKDDHTPATFTVLNFVVDDIDSAVDGLVAKGIEIIRYPEMGDWQDEKGIARGKSSNRGPDIAWFADPAGNILSVLSN